MATDYGNTIFEGELSPSVPVVNPIDNKSGQYLAQGIADTIKNTSSFLFSDDAKAAKADKVKNGTFAEMSEFVSYLADAKDQGIGTDEINRKLRVKTLEWVANNPNMTEEIHTFLNTLTADHGIGGSLRTLSPQEAGEKKNLEAAAEALFDTTNPESMKAWNDSKILAFRLKAIEDEISLAGAEGRMVSAQLKNEATLTLAGVVRTGTVWVTDGIKRTNALLMNAPDTKSKSAIIQQFKAEVANRTAFIRNQRTGAGDGIDVSYLLAGVDNIMKVWEETANGTAESSILETAIKAADNANILMAYQTNPKLAMLAALNKVSPFEMTNLIKEMDQEMSNTYTMLMDSGTPNADGTVTQGKPPDMIGPTEENALVAEALKGSTKNVLNDKDASPEVIQAQGTKLFNTMRSVVAYGANEVEAKYFMSVVDLFSDAAVGRFIETNPNTIDMTVASQAKDIITKQYESTVLPLINDEYETITALAYKNSTGAKTDPMGRILPNPDGAQADAQDLKDAIEPVWNGTGLQFVVKDEFSTDPTLRGVAKRLNADVSSAVNRLVRTHAHLTGTTDYEKIYNEQYAGRLFVKDGETDADSEKKLSELTNIPDYKGPQPPRPEGMKTTPTASIKGRAGQLLDALGEAEGADYTTLFGYDEQQGKAFDGTDITKMSIAEVQALQKKMVSTNGVSSAVGKYQFLQDTLREAVKALGISEDEKFTPEIQDKLALWLLQQRTSYQDWLSGVGDDNEFQDQLAKIWASVPNTSGKSHYASDGINNATSGGKALIGML